MSYNVIFKLVLILIVILGSYSDFVKGDYSSIILGIFIFISILEEKHKLLAGTLFLVGSLIFGVTCRNLYHNLYTFLIYFLVIFFVGSFSILQYYKQKKKSEKEVSKIEAPKESK